MAKFLTQEEVYRLIQRELPEDVYPDGQPSAYYATAEAGAVASAIGTAYANLQVIYTNFFPATANEKQADWEFSVLGAIQSAAQDLATRQTRVLSKLRSLASMSIPDMILVVKSVIGNDKIVEIAEFGNNTGSWLIGESELGVETYLGTFGKFFAIGPDLCAQSWTDWGMTQSDWLAMREDAYTYQVRIYSYSITADERTQLDIVLNAAEPARSQHVIADGLDPANMLGGTT